MTVAIHVICDSRSENWKAKRPRVLQAQYVLLDVGVRPHGLVELGQVAVLVAVVTPVTVLE